MENRKPGTRNLNKLPLQVLIPQINHCCQSILLSNTNSGFSPWHYFASISAKVRQSQEFMPKKPWKELFLALSYEEFPAKISISRASLEPWIALNAKTPKPHCFFDCSNLCYTMLLYQSQISNCPENSNNHHFLANTLIIMVIQSKKITY